MMTQNLEQLATTRNRCRILLVVTHCLLREIGPNRESSIARAADSMIDDTHSDSA